MRRFPTWQPPLRRRLQTSAAWRTRPSEFHGFASRPRDRFARSVWSRSARMRQGTTTFYRISRSQMGPCQGGRPATRGTSGRQEKRTAHGVCLLLGDWLRRLVELEAAQDAMARAPVPVLRADRKGGRHTECACYLEGRSEFQVSGLKKRGVALRARRPSSLGIGFSHALQSCAGATCGRRRKSKPNADIRRFEQWDERRRSARCAWCFWDWW